MLNVVVMDESSRSRKVVSSAYWDNLTSPRESGSATPLMLGLFQMLRGEKLNYKSVAEEISKPPFFRFLNSSGHQSLPCLFDSRFLEMFRTTPIFGMSRDHNRKHLKTRTELNVFEI